MAVADRGRFAVLGEPIVAVNLIDTIALPGSPAAVEFLSDSAKASLLRRCANPACSMIFVTVNPRRSWCVPGVCGNRVRVARHYRRSGA